MSFFVFFTKKIASLPPPLFSTPLSFHSLLPPNLPASKGGDSKRDDDDYNNNVFKGGGERK